MGGWQLGFLEDRIGLAGKTCLVVGGAGGLGRACTIDLARAGARVAVCDKNPEFLSKTVESLAELGINVFAQELDTRDHVALEHFYASVDDEYGRELHVLVNVVGGTFRQPFAESNPKGWDALIRTTLTWFLDSISHAIPRTRAAGGGSIINLTSIEAHRAAPGFTVYAAMKAAVHNLTKTLGSAMLSSGTRVISSALPSKLGAARWI
jgi:3-oxoacyl-[acyl-carrier protein] reductase